MECIQCLTFILDLDNFPCYRRKWSLEELLKVTKLLYWKWLMISSIECLFVIVVVPFYEFSFVQTQTFSRIIEQFYHEGIFTTKQYFTFLLFLCFSLLPLTLFISLSLRFSFAFHEIRRKIINLCCGFSFEWKSFLINGNFFVLWQVSFMEILLWLSYLFDILWDYLLKRRKIQGNLN